MGGFMTIEEAIEQLKQTLKQYMRGGDEEFDKQRKKAIIGAFEALCTAQELAKLDRSRWEGCEMCSTQWTKADWANGGAHDFRINGDTLYYFDAHFGWEGIKIKYCPICGCPLTKETWAEMARRIGSNNDN